ncbi:lysophospholipid acyltransferase family protein [bacterium]|nr:lysophospholipid acyltransferase family protein [bacterium]
MKDSTLYWIAGSVGPQIFKLINRTLRLSLVGTEQLAIAQEHGRVLLACFHGRMFCPVWEQRGKGVTALISQSRDGEAVARLVEAMGYKTVRGSSHRGGLDSFREMVKIQKQGTTTAVMVDGPRGPFEEPKAGTIAIARSGGAVIVPIMGASYPNWTFKSWDKFQLPKPFAKAVIGYGNPMIIPPRLKGDEVENYRTELQKQMIALKHELDERVRS